METCILYKSRVYILLKSSVSIYIYIHECVFYVVLLSLIIVIVYIGNDGGAHEMCTS